ncbi:MAG: hypothetical protein IPJ19_13465 [Planctomycetes bacterium]|nr:hypothetical protein [Planctomycetota bacterium]
MNATNLEISFAPRLRNLPLRIASSSAIVLGFLAGGCMKGTPAPITSGAAVGTVLDQPDPGIGSKTFVVDANHGGQANSVRLVASMWGRLVNVRDSSGEVQNTGVVIGEDIRTDNIDFVLDQNGITEETTVTILHLADTQAYKDAFARLDQNLTPVVDKDLNPNTLPPFTLLPRNSALVLKFDDLIDTSTIRRETIRLVTGYPALTPFDYHALQDVNHGDLFDEDGDGVLEFHTTRVILDMTVSTIESGQSDPPLPINNLGLPASINTSQANVGVRVPTQRDATIGQLTVLSNLAGHGLSFSTNGSHDSSVSTFDIVRGLRSGGSTAVTNDPHNGFLLDEIPPRVVGVQPVQISTPTGVAGDYVISIDYSLDFCALKPKVGDVIQQPGYFAEITQGPDNPSGGTVSNVHFRIVAPTTGVLAAGPAQIYTVWDPVANFGKQGCFARYSTIAPGITTPGTGVSTDSRVLLRFSEPMDPSTVTAFDNMKVLRVDPSTTTPTARDYVIAQVEGSSDLKEFSFNPIINFKHTLGSSNDRYYLSTGSGVLGPADLAGNPIVDALPAVTFTIDPNKATENNGGLVFRFSSQDELGADGKPEWRGQFSPDLNTGTIRPRPVTRLRATCDRTVQVPSAMLPFTQGLQTPISGLGSKLQALWRYCDVGFTLLDESAFNVDVEHIYWAPVGGNVVADSFDEFEIRLSHTKVLPDETFDPIANAAVFPNSGLVAEFDNNLLDGTNDPQSVVHPKGLGYMLDPAARKPSATGATTVMPYPLNQGIPVANYKYYTWRDNSLLAKGAVDPAMPGAELPIVVTLSGTGVAGCPYTNTSGNNPAPSIALPLLMEFRCFPDTGALGLNSLDVNTANPATRPNFRAFSTGGTNTSGQQVSINPDLEATAHGGFNPGSVPPGGPTPPTDNTVYLGELDLVLRISRMHSIWLDTQINSPTYLAPVLEPRASDQPAGAQIDIAYRGATNISGTNILTDATFIDPYGNPALCVVVPPPPPAPQCTFAPCTSNGVPTFFQSNSTWRSTITNINTAKYFQARVTFVSNTVTNLSPTLSALGFAFRQ